MPDARPLYNLRQLGHDHYAMAKFDEDFNVAAVYDLTPKGAGWACTCPASARVVKLRPCKHQRMLPYMLGAVNTDRFYEPETRSWVQPIAPNLTAEDIEALPDGVEKDYQHAMQDVAAAGGPQSGAPDIEDVDGDLAEIEQIVESRNNVAAHAEPPKIRRRV